MGGLGPTFYLYFFKERARIQSLDPLSSLQNHDLLSEAEPIKALALGPRHTGEPPVCRTVLVPRILLPERPVKVL